jgi:PLD-like domain
VRVGTAGQLRTFARTELLSKVGEAGARVWLASPFLTQPIAQELVEAALPEVDRRLLTALVASSVQVGALDPEALARLMDGGWKVGSIRNLHAKLSIVDSFWGLVGSGNLTNAGLGSTEKGNVELGVILDSTQIDAASSIYERWWREADEITGEDVARFAALPNKHHGVAGEAGVGPALEIGDPANLGSILDADNTERRFWVKANYYRRNADGRGWWHRGWISDWRKASYRKGDLILLYLGAAYEGPRCCPAIVRVIKEPRLDPDFVAENGDPEAQDRWPFVTEIECVFETPIENGVPLDAFDVTANGLQGGYKELSRSQFEAAAQYLMVSSGA